MKKTIAILMAVMMLAAFAGCSATEKLGEAIADAVQETSGAYVGTTYNGSVEFRDDSYLALSIDLSANSYDVTEEDIDAELVALSEYLAEEQEVTDRPVQDGDFVTIDFVGSVDGVEFDGGTAEDYELEIGSQSFIDDFEEQLIGSEIGDEVTVEVTFPDPYRNNEEMSGKDAVFKVTIKSISEQILPEITEELAVELGYADLAELRADAQQGLADSMEEQRSSDIEDAIWEQLENIAEIQVDEADLQTLVEQTYQEYTTYAEENGTDLETLLSLYFGMTTDEFYAYCEEMVADSVKKNLMTVALAEKLGIAVTDELYEAACLDLAEQNGFDTVEAFAESMEMTLEEYYTKESIVDYILRNEVLNALTETANIIG